MTNKATIEAVEALVALALSCDLPESDFDFDAFKEDALPILAAYHAAKMQEVVEKVEKLRELSSKEVKCWDECATDEDYINQGMVAAFDEVLVGLKEFKDAQSNTQSIMLESHAKGYKMGFEDAQKMIVKRLREWLEQK